LYQANSKRDGWWGPEKQAGGCLKNHREMCWNELGKVMAIQGSNWLK